MTGAFSEILAPDAALTTNGLDLRGRDDCARYLASVYAELRPYSVELESINGEPGLTIRRGTAVVGVTILRMRHGLIEHVWLVTDAEKLRSWN